MTILKVGDQAPDFAMLTNQKSQNTCSDLLGKFVVLYFYPKDDTPGCTIEAKNFSDLKPEFTELNTVILGISKDNLDSHHKFTQKYALQFDLVFDNTDICQKYGVWVEKSMYGKKYFGINRATFLIDPQGFIAYIWPKVSVDEHAQEVLEVIQGMG